MTSNSMFRIFLPFALFTCGVQCLAYCGYKTLYTSNSGKIALSNYGRDTDCTYRIKLSDSTRWIRLKWSSFKVDGDMPVCKDYVKVSTGCGYSSRLVAKFCSNNLNSFDLPHSVYSPDGCMSIQIKAVGSTKKSGLGFSAQYTSSPSYASESRSNCQSTNYEYSSTGVILSPNWPIGYSGYFPYYNKCEWKINRNSNEKIQLNFMDMNVISSSFSCYSTPYVKYEGEQSRSTSYFPEKKYCSSQIPFSKNTDYYELEVEMKQSTLSYSNKGRGFVVGWIAYTVDTTTTTATTVINTNTRYSSSNITTIGSVVTVIIIVVIVSIVVGLRCRAARTLRARNTFVQPNTNQVIINNSTTQSSDYQSAAPCGVPYQQLDYTNDSLGAPPPYPGPADPNMPYQNPPPYLPEQQGTAAAYPQQPAPYPQQQPAQYPPAQYPPQQPPAAPYPPQQPSTQYPPPEQPQTQYPSSQYPPAQQGHDYPTGAPPQ